MIAPNRSAKPCRYRRELCLWRSAISPPGSLRRRQDSQPTRHEVSRQWRHRMIFRKTSRKPRPGAGRTELSPPALAERALQAIAGTNVTASLDYEQRVRSFHTDLRNYYYPRLFRDAPFSPRALPSGRDSAEPACAEPANDYKLPTMSMKKPRLSYSASRRSSLKSVKL